MGGSTGVIGGVYSSPTTTYAEKQRSTDQAISSYPGAHEGVHRTTGIVNKIHPERPRLIKAHGRDGSPISNNQWIELNHSAQEIAERWGTVRIGFRVRVTYSGPAGSSADAVIIGSEGQDVNDPYIPNEAQQGVAFIFAPGIGV